MEFLILLGLAVVAGVSILVFVGRSRVRSSHEEEEEVEQRRPPPLAELSKPARPPTVAKRPSRHQPLPPEAGPRAEAWIVTAARPFDGLQARIEAHGELTEPEIRATVSVTLTQVDDFVAIGFPDGIPAVELVNLLGWIDDGALATRAVIVSPASGVRYVLEMDAANPAGDTAIAFGEDGTWLEVYLPEASLRPIAPRGAPWPVPPAPRGEERRFQLVVDTSADFGNPGFEVN